MPLMIPERWQQVKEIFDSALQRGPAERARFVFEACGEDEGLRKEIESLIAEHEKDGSFIDSPAYEDLATASALRQQVRSLLGLH